MSYFDDEKKEKYIPYVIEPSLGADRVVLAFLCAAYDEENIGTEEKPDMRTVLHFHPALAPVKIGVLPLSKKLNEGAEKIYAELAKTYNCEFDDRGNIGKRHRGMQVSHGLHLMMAQQHMEYTFPSSHHRNIPLAHRMYSDAVSDRNRYGLRFPTARPSQMGTGTQYPLYPYCRNKAPPENGHVHASHHP